MLRVKHVILILSLLSLGPALSACADFDPDKLDIFGINEKKKLPGERRPVFPEGVPGVTQGVPPDLVKGYQPPAEPEPQAAPVVAEKPKPRPRRVTRTPKRAPAQVTVQPTQPQQQQGGTTPWPDAPAAPRQAQQPAPWPSSAPAQQSQQPATQWPAPPPSGTFTR
ncbi:MAG: hypothetical protein J0H78_01140 [Rhizobiales bacterium]|nr:hypothetical protein [Hyphomicrobiales bacterium]OJY46062.1 MAG: hypothetical protein BGP08_06915 [Rhizobiales bacterium 64-17]